MSQGLASSFSAMRDSISFAMRFGGMSFVSIFCIVLISSCNQKAIEQKISKVEAAADSPDKPGGTDESSKPPKPISIIITPNLTDVAVGTSVRVSAIGVYPYGKMKDITDVTTWSANNSDIALFRSYDPPNSLSTISPGDVVVTGTYRDVTGSASIKVSKAKVVKLTASPASLDISGLMVGSVYTHDSVSYKIIATYSDGRIQDLTDKVDLKTESPIVTLSSPGNLTVGGAIEATIKASYENISTSLPIKAIVIAATPKYLTITPNPVVLPNGITIPLSATVTYNDTHVEDISTHVGASWISSDPAKFELIAEEGGPTKLKAKNTGQGEVTLTYADREAKVPIVATMGSLGRIDVSPGTVTVPLGATATFTATGVYSDGSTLDLTKAVTWSSNHQNVSFSTTEANNVLRASVKPSSPVLVTATFGGITGGATVNVTDKAIKSIEITPESPSIDKTDPIPVGSKWKVQFVATGFYSDGTTANLTNSALWSSQSSGAPQASIMINKGLVTGTLPGKIALKATVSGITGTLPLTISERTLEGLTLKIFADENRTFPVLNTSAPLGKERWLGLYADYSDGSSNQPVTKEATWSFAYSTPGYTYSAYVLDSAEENGRWKGYAKGISIGTTRITAAFKGLTRDLEFEVTPKELESLNKLNDNDLSFIVGDKSQFNVNGIYTDGTIKTLTELFDDSSLLKAFSRFDGQTPTVINVGSSTNNFGAITANLEGYEVIKLAVTDIASNQTVEATWNVSISSKCDAAQGGKRYDRFCWFLSDFDQDCDQRCDLANSNYHDATAWLAGSTGHCSQILKTLLNLSAAPSVETDSHPSVGLGCGRQTVYATETDDFGNDVQIEQYFDIFFQSPMVTSSAKASDFRRVCACRQR